MMTSLILLLAVVTHGVLQHLGDGCEIKDNKSTCSCKSFVSSQEKVIERLSVVATTIQEITENKCSKGEGNSGCGGPGYITSPCAVLQSINWRKGMYHPDLVCAWLIRSPRDQMVVLTVRQFHLEYSGPDCYWDHLTIFSGSYGTDDRYLGRFCGKRAPWKMNTMSNMVTIIFRSNKEHQRPGFYIMSESVPIKHIKEVSFHRQILNNNGSVSLMNANVTRPNKLFMTQNPISTVTWLIQTFIGKKLVTLARTVFSGTQDWTVRVYDGPNDNCAEINTTNDSYPTMHYNGRSFMMFIRLEARLSLLFDNIDFDFVADFNSVIVEYDQEKRVEDHHPVTVYFKWPLGGAHIQYISLVTQPGRRLQVEVTKFIFPGPNADGCQIEGFAMYEEGLRMFGPYCGDETDAMLPIERRVYYSSGTSAILALYAYPVLQMARNVTVSIRVTSTACSVINTESLVRGEKDITDVAEVNYIKGQTSFKDVFIKPHKGACFHIQAVPILKPASFGLEIHVNTNLTERLNFQLNERYFESTKTECIMSTFALAADVGLPSWRKLAAPSTISFLTNNAKFRIAVECPFPTYSMFLTVRDDTIGECETVIIDKDKPFAKYNAICGTVLFYPRITKKTHLEARALLSAPQQTYRNAYYVIRFHEFKVPCDDQCGHTSLMVEEDVTHDSRTYLSPNFPTNSLPLTHKTFGTDYVRINVIVSNFYKLFKRFHSFAMEYNIKFYQEFRNISHPSCPDETLHYKGNCYLFVRPQYPEPNDKSWLEAENECVNTGEEMGLAGHLVSIGSREEMDFLRTMIATRWREDFVAAQKWIIMIGLQDKMGNGLLEWTDGNPLTYTEWYNPNDWFARAFTNLRLQTSKLHISAKFPQPWNDPGSRCTAMFFMGPHYPLNWMKIPCKIPYKDGAFFCKMTRLIRPLNQTNSQYADLVPRQNTILSAAPIICPSRYLLSGERCLTIINNYKGNTGAKKTLFQASCSKINGNVLYANMSLIYGIKPHIVALLGTERHSATVAFEMENLAGDIKCLRVNYPDDFIHDNQCESVSHILCESPTINITLDCNMKQFQCEDRSCISADHICDGKQNCPGNEDELNCTVLRVFYCDKKYISINSFCDFISDCEDGSDETDCMHAECTRDQFRCNSGQCIPESFRCNLKKDCRYSSDEDDCAVGNCRHGFFTCSSGNCIPSENVNDMVPDCPGLSQEDEEDSIGHDMQIELFTAKVEYFPVTANCSLDESQCSLNHTKCYNRGETCIFDKGLLGHRKTCRNSAHLEQCEHVLCPGRFKCPSSYCIPHRFVCDRQKDCTGGADEEPSLCSNLTCPGLFRCSGQMKCIDQSQVCDGQTHCDTSTEDERFCSYLSCHEGCHCTEHNITCMNAGLSGIPMLQKRFLNINLSNNSLFLKSFGFSNMWWLRTLDISYNMIENIPPNAFRYMTSLTKLDLRFNNIIILNSDSFLELYSLTELYLNGNMLGVINSKAFQGLSSLPELDLVSMQIEKLQNEAFHGLTSLKKLQLDHNDIQALNTKTFKGLDNLRILTIIGNKVPIIEPHTFKLLPLNQLKSSAYKFCCLASHVKDCTPEPDIFSSCEDLMANPVQLGAIWILGGAALVANIAVLVWRYLREPTRVSSFLVQNLGVADTLMGLYLLIIAGADQYYRGRYIIHADQWMTSTFCRLAGFLSMLSSQTSLYMLVLITWDRLIAITMPLSSHRLSLQRARIYVSVFWIICSVISAIPVFGLSHFGSNYIRNGACLLFNFTAGKSRGWEYTLTLFILPSIVALTFILISYLIIFITARRSRLAAGRKADIRADLNIARKMIVVIASDAICWIPVASLSISSLVGVRIPDDVTSWIAVFVVPINSAVNPIIYTFSNINLQELLPAGDKSKPIAAKKCLTCSKMFIRKENTLSVKLRSIKRGLTDKSNKRE